MATRRKRKNGALFSPREIKAMAKFIPAKVRKVGSKIVVKISPSNLKKILKANPYRGPRGPLGIGNLGARVVVAGKTVKKGFHSNYNASQFARKLSKKIGAPVQVYDQFGLYMTYGRASNPTHIAQDANNGKWYVKAPNGKVYGPFKSKRSAQIYYTRKLK